MASPATVMLNHQTQPLDDNSDYGSEFSPEEEEIVNRMLISAERTAEIKDNPIFIGVEYHESAQTVRIPRALAQERRFETPEYRKTSVNFVGLSIEVVDPSSKDGRLASPLHYRQH